MDNKIDLIDDENTDDIDEVKIKSKNVHPNKESKIKTKLTNASSF